jgi:hypothetical protein
MIRKTPTLRNSRYLYKFYNVYVLKSLKSPLNVYKGTQMSIGGKQLVPKVYQWKTTYTQGLSAESNGYPKIDQRKATGALRSIINLQKSHKKSTKSQ